MKQHGRKTQVGTDKQVLSTHFLTFITPLVVVLSCRQLSCSKSDGKYATLLHDSKACKASRKFNAGVLIIKKEMGGPQKAKGLPPSDNPAAALPGYAE
jgi:hypothetical protein